MKKAGKHVLLLAMMIIIGVIMLPIGSSAASSSKLKKPQVTLSNVASTGKIKISWKKVNKAKSYKIYRSTDGKKWELLIKTTKTSTVHDSAKAGKLYYYKVKAIAAKSANNSSFSKVKSLRCDLAKPEIKLTDVSPSGKIKVSWKKITGAVRYKVYASRDKKNWSLISTTAKTNLTHKKAVAGKKYYYKVKAVASNTSANSIFSSIKYRTCKYPEEVVGTRYVYRTEVILYMSPDWDSKTLAIPYMTQVKLGKAVETYTNGYWYKVYYNDRTYYVFLEWDSDKFTTKKSSFSYSGGTIYQQEVVNLAEDICRNWNTVYAHNQSNGILNDDGTYGFDCSGLVTYILNTVMRKHVPTYKVTSSISKLTELGSIYNGGYNGEFCAKTVELEDIQPGDVLFFSEDATNDHCGIYLGNGEFANCSSYWMEACIMPLRGRPVENLTLIRRYLPTEVAEADESMASTFTCNVYEKMDSASECIGKLPKGTQVTVLFTNSNQWAYVKDPDGMEGFVYLKNLK